MRSVLLSMLVLFAIVGTTYGIVLKKSIEELATESSLIVKGKVVEKKSYWNNAHNRIWTDITIRVSEYIKGKGNPVITFRVPGGTVGDTTLYVSDAPRWNVGEEVILFLNPDFYYPVAGWFQGKYRIEGDVAVNEIDAERSIPLREMLSRIRKALKGIE